MARLIEHVIASGANGMLILGSGGEFPHISTSDRKLIAEFCLRQINHRIPVLIGIACSGTKETIELGLHAQQHGADGLLVVNK
ncbi:dihydrodipicolinate synthase family protein [Pseudomonas inefficax]|nr:dihydrodipicolinate synthase family protein [Pseudomonas inefficax]